MLHVISIVIPTINEEESIGQVIDRIADAMKSTGREYEIIVVDTNSRDRTVEIARSRGCNVVEEKRRGYGRAYKTGFAASKGNVIIAMDADSSYPPEAIPRLLQSFDDGNFDFITANRFVSMDRGAMNRTHKFGNWVLNIATKLLFRVSITDSQSGMWIMKKEAYEGLNVTSNGFPFSEEIKIRAARSLRFMEVPIDFVERKGEKKLSTWRDGWNNLKFLLKLRFSRDF
ncbi:MAG: glycosyltransferase family 2 protein [Thermoplasmata archaeon]|nr:glycosyltransferase family 2 protein [Candidatus Sysuiplasma acidicola]MBX8637219.1 glycosyltransferase family 2 protein [Candidatus Sysuiplasma acidicola]MBX8646026.1 glycosyltransferase family 2 protein [Candidatus Sysuiplasma acidicola]